MTKIDDRTKKGAAKQIDDSLRRLQADHVDLLQFHEGIGTPTQIGFFPWQWNGGGH